MKRIILASLALSVTSGAAVTLPPKALKGDTFMKMATISLKAARNAALKARPGKITDQELEKEKGGSGLRYSFDIGSGGKTYEVGVDAKTGTVVENAIEGKGAD